MGELFQSFCRDTQTKTFFSVFLKQVLIKSRRKCDLLCDDFLNDIGEDDEQLFLTSMYVMVSILWKSVDQFRFLSFIVYY